MAIQAQVENFGFALAGSGSGSQDWMENGCGFNQFCFNFPSKDMQQQQQQLQNLQQNCVLQLPMNNCKSITFSRTIASQIENQTQEIDRFINLQNERLRLALQEQRKQQLTLLLKKYEPKTLILLKQKDEEIAKAVQRTKELEEFLRRVELENQTWQRMAKQNEAMVLSLNNTIEQVKENACFTNGVEDAESSCDVMNRGGTEDETGENRGHKNEEENEEQRTRKMVCRSCNFRSSCVIFLPCRHLCSCKACEGFLDSCPVCGMAKKASIEVLI
uniref:Putative BOI-related E3 ubiquitin-protein ligase 2 n=1 Tax=Davidia involucrata TaxID=16924 RepID=A0A5B6ZCP2_DAVIN